VACPLPAGGHRLLNGNEVAALLTEFRISSLKDAGILPAAGSPNAAVVKSLVTTPLVAAICARQGVRCVETLVGFKWICSAIDRHGPEHFVFGTEESHGYLAGTHVRDKDASVAALLMAEQTATLKAAGRTPHERLDELYAALGCHQEPPMVAANVHVDAKAPPDDGGSSRGSAGGLQHAQALESLRDGGEGFDGAGV
jgi:phosphoglucomutase/phosphomannomutase